MDRFLVENEHLINNLYYGFAEKSIQKNSSFYINTLGVLSIISVFIVIVNSVPTPANKILANVMERYNLQGFFAPKPGTESSTDTNTKKNTENDKNVASEVSLQEQPEFQNNNIGDLVDTDEVLSDFEY